MNYRTMTEIATEEIREGIIAGIYKPGKRLIPANLEKELKLGRVAIREALRELAALGIVTLIPNKGATVAETIPTEELKQLYEIRYLVEGKAAYVATKRISVEVFQKLGDLHKQMCSLEVRHADRFNLNKEFHLTLYRTSGWSYLCQIIEQLIDKTRILRGGFIFSPEDIKAFNEIHKTILEALERRQAKDVREAVILNLKDAFRRILTASER